MPDLSNLELLSIYEVAKRLEAENDKPLIVWLHLIVRAVCSGKLSLRPSRFWRTKSFDTWAALRDGKVTWTLRESVLWQYLYPPRNTDIPTDLKRIMETEGVSIRHKDFQSWFESEGYPLPHFWFSDEERNKTEKQALTPAKRADIGLKALALDFLRSKNKGTPLMELVDDLAREYRQKGQAAYRLLVDSGHTKDSKNLIAQQDAETDKKKIKKIGGYMRRELLNLKKK